MRAQVVVRQDDRVLMVRLERPGRSFWVLPGGAVEPDETPEEAAVREVREETGLDVAVERLLFVDQPRMAGGIEIRSPRYTYLAGVIGGQLERAAEEVAEVAWLPLDWGQFDPSTQDTMDLVRKSLQQL